VITDNNIKATRCIFFMILINIRLSTVLNIFINTNKYQAILNYFSIFYLIFTIFCI
jgi:hypothetical protein